jgi:hypothetical protein
MSLQPLLKEGTRGGSGRLRVRGALVIEFFSSYSHRWL